MTDEDRRTEGVDGVSDTVESTSSAPGVPALVRLFLREIDTASACTTKLCHAISGRDLAGPLEVSLRLSRAWGRAKTAIFVLERQSQRSEAFARDALQHSFDAARTPLAQAWELLCPDEQWSSCLPTPEDTRLPQDVAKNHKRHHDP